MGRYNLLIETPILILIVAAFFIPQAEATERTAITISSPQLDQTIATSDISFGGTYTEVPNTTPNALPSGTILSYEVELSIDNGRTIETYFQDGQWSYSTTLGDGWHTVTASISDNTGSGATSDTIQFLVITGHVAPTRYNLILIEYSGTCATMIKNHIKSNCPPLLVLKKVDTSNQEVAGKFINENGTWIRTKPQIGLWWNFVNATGKPTVCVDCVFDLANPELAQLIMIDPANFTYASIAPVQTQIEIQSAANGSRYIPIIAPDQSSTITTLDVNYGRFVTPDCLGANLDYNPVYLADTIAYLESNCKITHLTLNSTIAIKPIPFDFVHSNWYREYQWLNRVTQNDTMNCINHICKTLKDPFANW